MTDPKVVVIEQQAYQMVLSLASLLILYIIYNDLRCTARCLLTSTSLCSTQVQKKTVEHDWENVSQFFFLVGTIYAPSVQYIGFLFCGFWTAALFRSSIDRSYRCWLIPTYRKWNSFQMSRPTIIKQIVMFHYLNDVKCWYIKGGWLASLVSHVFRFFML